GVQAFSAQDCSDPTNVGGGVNLCQNTQLRLHRKSPTPRPIRQFGRRCRRGRHCGRPPASLRTSPGGTVRFNFFVLHDHVMVVLRPCEAKLSGLRCLTIIGTEGNVACRFPAPRSSAVGSQLSLLSVQVSFPWSADLLTEYKAVTPVEWSPCRPRTIQ